MNNVQPTNFHYQIPMDEDDGDVNTNYEHDGENRDSMPGQLHDSSEDNVAQPYMSAQDGGHQPH